MMKNHKLKLLKWINLQYLVLYDALYENGAGNVQIKLIRINSYLRLLVIL